MFSRCFIWHPLFSTAYLEHAVLRHDVDAMYVVSWQKYQAVNVYCAYPASTGSKGDRHRGRAASVAPSISEEHQKLAAYPPATRLLLPLFCYMGRLA